LPAARSRRCAAAAPKAASIDDFTPMWSGQAATLAHAAARRRLTRRLAADALARLQRP
jgi:hypothetical protein